MKDRYVLKDKHWNFKKFKVDDEEVEFWQKKKMNAAQVWSF